MVDAVIVVRIGVVRVCRLLNGSEFMREIVILVWI